MGEHIHSFYVYLDIKSELRHDPANKHYYSRKTSRKIITQIEYYIRVGGQHIEGLRTQHVSTPIWLKQLLFEYP